MYRAAVIIPAYNEEKTIGNVISSALKVELLSEIIVVNDGSTDRTLDIAQKYNVKIIDLKENLGKGGALRKGVNFTDSDVILFLDADLIGLNPSHINSLLLPVLKEEVDMTIGVFNNGRFTTDLAQKIAPNLSGQRALKRNVFESISNIDLTRYGVEVALNRHVQRNNIVFKEVILNNVSHVMKEEKLGLLKGFSSRLRMYYDILKVMINKEG